MKKNVRNFEIDFFRGVAVILMIYFHTIFDLKEFFGFNVNYLSGYNFYIGKTAAVLFILVSGISSSLSKSNLKRGLKFFAYAMIITLITNFISGMEIYFGILHFLGLSMIFAHFLLFLKPKVFYISNILILIICIGLDGIIRGLVPTNNYLLMFGIINDNFASADFYPLVPWFGVFSIGLIIGKFFYRGTIQSYAFRNNFINLVGRNSLVVYFVHQPIILILLYIYIKLL